MEEIWKDIEGYEGLYEVSSYGRVRNLVSGKFIKPSQKNDGYCRVCLYKNGGGKCINIHRLVAQAFIPNPDNLPEINHLDEDKTNNRVDNLEFCNHKYNCNYGTLQQRRILTNINSGKYTGLTRTEYCKKYRENNKEYFKEYRKDYYQSNKEKLKEHSKNYYENNKEYYKEYNSEYYKKHKK